MSTRLRAALCLLAVLDAAAGGLLVCWPGAWQEVLHPEAIGSTFYPLQYTGAVWLARAALTVWVAARRPDARALVGAAWAVEVPAELLMAARTVGAGSWAVPFHLGRAALAAAVGVSLMWRVRTNRDAGSQ